MRTVCYCRFSSDNQKETSIEFQLRSITMHCENTGLPEPRVFKDSALSATHTDRPGYIAMMRAAAAGEFDTLILYDLSRLSRDSVESTKALRQLSFHGIRVIAINDGIDTDRPGYKINAGLKGLMNELFIDDLSRRVKDGLSLQNSKGYATGKLPYGYKSIYDGNGHTRVIDEEEAKWVRFIFKLYSEGKSARQIAYELNQKGVPARNGKKWTFSTIHPDKGKGRTGMLGNELYVGRWVYNKSKNVRDPLTNKSVQKLLPKSEWKVLELPELRIVSEDTWKLVVARRERAKLSYRRGSTGRPSNNLFNGILRCGVCGEKYVLRNRLYMGCKNSVDKLDSTCSNRRLISIKRLDEMLLESAKRDLLTEEAYAEFERITAEMMRINPPDTGPIHKKMQDAQKEVDNIMNAIKLGIVTATTKTALEDAERRIAEYKSELEAAKGFSAEKVLPMAKKCYKDMVMNLANLDNAYLAREALRQLLGTVTLRPVEGTKRELVAELEHGTLSSALSEMMLFPPQIDHFIQKRPRVVSLYS